MNDDEKAALAEANSGVKTLAGKFQELSEKLANINWVLTVLVIALFIGFAGTFVATAGILIDSWNNKASSYRELENEVKGLRSDFHAIFDGAQMEEEEPVEPIGPIK